jgi:ABC-type multidrug transport system ATPase subunit
MVPQDDVVHGQLTVHQALMYAAELRLPPDTTKEDREQVVAQVLEELEMTQHAEPGWTSCPAGSASGPRWPWNC